MAKILLADDDEDVIRLIRRILEGLGHQVVSTTNGLETLKLGMNDDFDLYIFDVRMPRLDGYSLCRSITRKFPARNVVLITGLDTQKYEPMAKASGATITIAKPFDADKFKKAIQPFLP